MSNYFSWEQKYKRTWETNDNGSLEKRTKPCNMKKSDSENIRRLGLIRHLSIIIDKSKNIDLNDFLPSFRIVIKEKIRFFVDRFGEENPISKLTLSIIQEDKVNTDLKFLDTPGSGEFSLQNALETGYMSLKDSSNIKEILIITFSISVKDMFDVDDTIKKIIANDIKVSAINMCAELNVLKKLCKKTGGEFHVPIDEYHFETMLMSFLIPKGSLNPKVNLIKIGFPEPKKIEKGKFPVCVCHLTPIVSTKIAFQCVICNSYICDIPVECPLCQTMNINSMNLCGNIHHMYPLKEFSKFEGNCSICGNNELTRQCDSCPAIYCDDCNNFIHENINQCCFCDNN